MQGHSRNYIWPPEYRSAGVRTLSSAPGEMFRFHTKRENFSLFAEFKRTVVGPEQKTLQTPRNMFWTATVDISVTDMFWHGTVK